MPSYSAAAPRLRACSPLLSTSACTRYYCSASSASQQSGSGSSLPLSSATQQSGSGSSLPLSSASSSSYLTSNMCGRFSVERFHFRCPTQDNICSRSLDVFPYRPGRIHLSFNASQHSVRYFNPRSSVFLGPFLRGTATSQDAMASIFRSERPRLIFRSSSCDKKIIESNASPDTAPFDERKSEQKLLSHSTCQEVDTNLAGVGKVGVEQSAVYQKDEPEATCLDQDANRLVSIPSSEVVKPLGGRYSRKLSSSDVAVSRARSRSERRRKGAAFARQIESTDLRAVPGIGPRNLEKLVAKGIGKVAELKQLYCDKFINDESQQMVDFLQSSVGIVHKNHAESITSYVKNSVEEDQKQQSLAGKESCNVQQKKVTICVEGNISVGKTTFLRKVASEIIELRDLIEIVPEPVDKWKDVGPEHFNLLDAFYTEPERYAYTFQNYVFATRLMKEQETSKGVKPLRLMERSIFSDHLVFVRAVHEAKWMNELELRIYESWFDPFISALPGLVPDGFIYLRASPDTCLQRLHIRNRPEEQSVTLEYLKGLHEKHEQCFFPSERAGGVFSVNSMPSNPHGLPPSPRIRDQVFYLEGDHLHSSIRKVPALILDCEASIDFNRDHEAKAEYAQQVAEFIEYIRSNKDLEMSKPAPSGIVNPFLLPYMERFSKPDGYSFLHGKFPDLQILSHNFNPQQERINRA